MLIGLDASRAFGKARTGVENYSYHLLLALANLECQERFRVYVRGHSGKRPAAEHFARFFSRLRWEKDDTDYLSEEVVTRSQRFGFGRGSESPLRRQVDRVTLKAIKWPVLWTQGGLAMETWLNSPDLLFIPAHTVPFFKNPRVKTVVTVHDLWTQDLPQSQNRIQRLYLNLTMEKIRARLATHIIAVSESTKKDIVELLGINPNKVTVVYEGVKSRRFTPALKAQGARLKEVRKKYGVGESYFLFVGTIQPRKNLARLIEAFANLEPRTLNLELILAGQQGWMAGEIYAAPKRLGVGERVKFLDYVADQDLPFLYAGARAFVLPSLHEGFGLPVLEAMSCGVSVVCSRVSSLPEVGGESPIYVDPLRVEDLARGLGRTLTEPESQRQERIEKGLKQAAKFSWQKCARETLAVFEHVLKTASARGSS